MIPQRLQQEQMLLEKYFHGRYRFVSSPTEHLDVGIQTSTGSVYRINIILQPDYPNSIPEVRIVYPLPLNTFEGEPLKEASHAMHILGRAGQSIIICHFKSWTPRDSLYKVIFKARLWLEAYEGHKRTGRTIDSYLKS